MIIWGNIVTISDVLGTALCIFHALSPLVLVALLRGSPFYYLCITEVEKAAERLESLSQMTQLDTGASTRVQTRSPSDSSTSLSSREKESQEPGEKVTSQNSCEGGGTCL